MVKGSVLLGLILVTGLSMSLSSAFAQTTGETNEPNWFREARSESDASTGHRGAAGDWIRSAAALSFVVLLALGFLWGIRRWMPKVVTPTGRRIRVVESTMLAPHKSLHLVEVGSSSLLIGSSRDRLCLLGQVDSLTNASEDRETILSEGTHL